MPQTRGRLGRGRAAVARPRAQRRVALIVLAALCLLPACDRSPASVSTGNDKVSPSARSGQTVVSLTFDDAYENHFLYARPLLLTYGMTATFYVITSDSDRPYRCCMSWKELRILQADGNDIGSHTVTHPYVTHLTPSELTREVCDSRQVMLSNGIIDPQSFAYPFGTYDAAAERTVRRCRFTNARQGGGISPSNTTPGAPYAESLPPKDPYAVRTVAVDGSSPIQLTHLKRFVLAAAAHGGGWLPITFHQVCKADAADYGTCMSSYGPIQDTVLAQFLAWLGAAGKPGGAPARVVVRTMREAITVKP
ncbi:MAG: putative xylanase/chitin deacetylase [Pseudonocardiales bacterium]|nr:putative xylanase/chitin deacetylase [Pseudonocardiales bacterium]